MLLCHFVTCYSFEQLGHYNRIKLASFLLLVKNEGTSLIQDKLLTLLARHLLLISERLQLLHAVHLLSLSKWPMMMLNRALLVHMLLHWIGSEVVRFGYCGRSTVVIFSTTQIHINFFLLNFQCNYCLFKVFDISTLFMWVFCTFKCALF